MKRIIYSCLLLLSLFLVKNSNAQVFAFTVTPITYCHDGTTPVPAQAAVTSSGVANSFSFDILAPAGCPVPGTAVYDPLFPDGSVVSFTYWCCGNYTIVANPFINGAPLAQDFKYPTSTCVNALTITTVPANSVICQGQSATLTASGANTYTWSNGVVGPQIVVSPTAATCYTVVGSTLTGCTVTANSCISVQSASVSISPASQTLCAGSTTTLYATASANSLGIQWAQPYAPQILGTNLSQQITVPNLAPVGTPFEYTAGIVTVGPAGNCTAAATATITVDTAIPMTLTSSHASVCPTQAFTLTAGPPGATSYTFTKVNPGPTLNFFSTTNTIVLSTGAGIYTVHALYGTCPGTAAVIIGTTGLTPTLTATSGSLTCPTRTVNLAANVTGASNYTFTYGGPPPSTIGIGTSSTAFHVSPATPSVYNYSVFVSGPGGCVGSASISVHTATVYPRFSATSPHSVCPVTAFTLTEEGGTTYTLTGSAGVTSGPVTANTASASIPLGSFPATMTLQADSLGCSNTTTIVINKRTLNPTITASSASVCTGGTFTLTSAFNSPINNSISSYTYTAPNNVTITPITANSGTATSSIISATIFPATFTVVADSAGCEGVASITIHSLSLNSALSLTVSASSQSVCPNSQFTLVASNSATATSGSVTNYTVLGQSPIVYAPISPKGDTLSSTIPLGSFPGQYTVAAESGGCVGTQTFAIERLYINPTLSITPTGSICAGAPITLTASPTTTNVLAPMSYSFYAAPLANPTTSAQVQSGPTYTATHNPTVATIYAVIADSSGCTTLVPGTATIGILPNLTLTLTSTSPTVCSGMEATLSVVSSPNYTYTWFASTNPTFTLPTLPTTPPDTAIVVNPTVSTTYTVHAATAGNCMGDAVITISVNPTASLSILASASPTAMCPGGSATITATGALSYTWIPSTSLNNANTPVVISTPSATIIYTVIGDNTLGCYGAATVVANVVAYPSLTVAITASAVCVGYTSTLTAFGATSYTWAGSNITPVYQAALAAGPGTYTLYASNGGNCIDSSIVKEILLAPDLIILATPALSGTTCIANNNPKQSKPVVLNASGGSSYTWLPYNPSSMTYSLGPQTTVIPPASTCYTVTGYTTVCSGSAVVCVTVIPQFTMNVVPPLPAMCTGDSLKLNIVNISTLAVGPTSAFTYSWTEPGNAVLSLSNPLSPTVIAFPQSTSTYSVEMRDSRSCVSIPRLVTVTVYPRPLTAVSIPTINGIATNTICYVGNQPGEEGNLLTLTASNQNVGLPFGVVPTYTWLPPAQYVNTSILTPPNNNNVTVNAPVRTPSVVVYSVISGYNGIPGCSRFDTVSVRVIDCRPITPGKIKFITDRVDTICTRECLTFTSLTDTAAGGPQKLLWSFSGGAPATSTLQFPTVCYNLPNDKSNKGYNVTLKVENPYPTSKGGSSASAGLFNFVTVVDPPNVSIVAPGGIASDTTVRFGQSVGLNGSGALSYNWSPFYNISSSTNPNVVVHPFQTTQYILTGYNSKNCFSSDTVNVIIIPDCGEMYVPNAFSPNDDGSNDILYARGICLESLTFMVFNRWGEKVFETIDQKVGWNGMYRGEEANSGVYVYRLEGKTYDGKAFSSKGNITLIR